MRDLLKQETIRTIQQCLQKDLSLPSRKSCKKPLIRQRIKKQRLALAKKYALSGFLNGMLEVFEPGALNYFTFFRPTLSTLSVSRNSILIHLSLSGFLDSLLCVLIPPTPSLAFSLLMPRTLAVALSFSSGRAYPSLNFPPPLSLRLIPTLIM